MQILFLFRFPFSIKSPNGFSLGVLSTSVCAAVYIALFSIVVSLDIGFSCYSCACFDVFEHLTSEIEQITRDDIQCSKTLRLRLFSMIKFHLKIFDLLDKIQQIKSGPYFQQLCTYTVFIAHSLNSPVRDGFVIILNASPLLMIEILLNVCLFISHRILKSLL